MRDDFSTLDICKTLQIPRERLRSWMKEGFIEPNTQAEGQGTKAIFKRQRVYRIAVFKSYIERGFDRRTAADLASIVEDIDTKGNFEFCLFLNASSPVLGLINNAKAEKIDLTKVIDLHQIANLPRLAGFGFDNFKGVIEYLKKYEHSKKDVVKVDSIEFIEIFNFGAIKRSVDILLSALEE